MSMQPERQELGGGRTALAAAWSRVASALRLRLDQSGAGGAGELLARVRTMPRPGWVGAVAEVCRRDPRKAGVFAGLVVVLISLWIRQGVDPATRGPATASAARSGRGGVNLAGRDPSRRSPDVEAAVSDWRSMPVLPPRNLFAVKFDYFPRDGSRAAEPVRGGQGFWAELGKSLASRTDEKKQRQVLIENLRLSAATLRLETTMMGARPKAVINGEMVGEGDVVASGSGATRTVFRVSQIEARRVIVEREGIKLEIPMK